MSNLTKRTARVFLVLCLALKLSLICEETADSRSASPTIPASNGCLPATTTANEMNRVIYQEFPAHGPTETAWQIVWTEFGNKGLWIEEANFTPKPGATPIQVLGQTGLSNIFVPYHAGWRILDFNQWAELLAASPEYIGPCGTISGPALLGPASGNTRQVLVKEIRDRGVAWIKINRARRGEELLLWAVYDPGGYNYIVQYGFRDDGTITFRMGSTGSNNGGMPDQAHMHNALWYIDINLAGSDHDSVGLMKHVEPGTSSITATDSMIQFNNGLEGFADWKAEEFTGLTTRDNLVMNARGNKISYDLMPLRTGTARHDENFTYHDFWVTKNPNSGQLLTAASEIYYENLGDQNLGYTINNENIDDTDVVLWHISSNHHLPRDEDHEFDAQGNWLSGVAQVMWSGFDLHPRNVLDESPLYEPCAAIPQNMVAWWRLDEGVGAITVADSQLSGNNGMPKPASLGTTGPSAVPGVVNGGLAFDGVDDYVEIPDNAALNFGVGDFSADTWIKTTQNSGVRVILDKRFEAGSPSSGTSGQKSKQPASQVGSAPTGYHLYLDNGKPGVQLAYGGSHFNYTSNTSVADGNWHHLAVTVNRTGSNGKPKEIQWYVDGLSVDTHPLPALTGSLDNTSPLRLAVRSSSLSGYWNGVLDELELFSNVVSKDDMFTIYAAGRAGKCR